MGGGLHFAVPPSAERLPDNPSASFTASRSSTADIFYAFSYASDRQLSHVHLLL